MLIDSIPGSATDPAFRIAAVILATALAVVGIVKTREPLMVVSPLLFALHWASFLPDPWAAFVSLGATASMLVGLQRLVWQLRAERRGTPPPDRTPGPGGA